MKSARIFALAACLTLLSGCLPEQELPTFDGPYIVQYYDGPGTCEVGMDYQGNARLYFGIDFYSDEVETYSKGATGTRGEKYQALCDKHGDNDFHGKDPYFESAQKKCYAKDFKALTVTTLYDYDPEHPAGSSLDDIAVYDAYTPYLWIKSGYNGDPEFTHILKYVQNVTQEDMTLLCYAGWFSIYFSKMPVGASTVKVKVTITTDEDEVMEFERDMLIY